MAEQDQYDLVEESDRGCVLLGAAILEERLEQMFRLVFKVNGVSNKLTDSIFGSNGPLATFSSKAKMAFSLGFVGKRTYEDLETIRKIRNEFAHTSKEVDFIKGEVSRKIESLHCTQQFKGRMERFSPSSDAVEPPSESEMRVAGYVKHAKSLFALGVKSLETDLLRCQIAIVRNDA